MTATIARTMTMTVARPAMRPMTNFSRIQAAITRTTSARRRFSSEGLAASSFMTYRLVRSVKRRLSRRMRASDRGRPLGARGRRTLLSSVVAPTKMIETIGPGRVGRVLVVDVQTGEAVAADGRRVLARPQPPTLADEDDPRQRRCGGVGHGQHDAPRGAPIPYPDGRKFRT